MTRIELDLGKTVRAWSNIKEIGRKEM